MRWPRRGILLRLLIYVPVISLLVWRAQGGCDPSPREPQEDPLKKKLEPHRKVITLPDGTQQEIVELTAEEAEAILGHPIPRNLDEVGEDAKAGAEAKAGAGAKADAGATADARGEGAEVKADAKLADD